MSGILTVECSLLGLLHENDEKGFKDLYIFEVPFENEEQGRYLVNNIYQLELDSPDSLADTIMMSEGFCKLRPSKGFYWDVDVNDSDMHKVFSEEVENPDVWLWGRIFPHRYITVRGESRQTESERSYYEGVMEQLFTENVV
jgi:hypothetical protein